MYCKKFYLLFISNRKFGVCRAIMGVNNIFCNQRHLPYLFDYKSHSSIRHPPEIGPRIRYKIFHDNLKHPQELHEDTQSAHKSSSLTVVKTMFPMFTHEAPCLFLAFHVFRISLSNKINKRTLPY